MHRGNDIAEEVPPELLKLKSFGRVLAGELAAQTTLHGVSVQIASLEVYTLHICVRNSVIVEKRGHAQGRREAVPFALVAQLFKRFVET